MHPLAGAESLRGGGPGWGPGHMAGPVRSNPRGAIPPRSPPPPRGPRRHRRAELGEEAEEEELRAKDQITQDLVRKYIRYARAHVRPTISQARRRPLGSLNPSPRVYAQGGGRWSPTGALGGTGQKTYRMLFTRGKGNLSTVPEAGGGGGWAFPTP